MQDRRPPDRGRFFFQAEDGIRGGTVTGVQTCALPICPRQEWIEIAVPALVSQASFELQPLLSQFKARLAHQGRHRYFYPLLPRTRSLGSVATDTTALLSGGPVQPRRRPGGGLSKAGPAPISRVL